ncbi:hypothetical protein [Escherichia phage EP_H11]|nr:hypothetical protein [Escherichia phage EP_H11]
MDQPIQTVINAVGSMQIVGYDTYEQVAQTVKLDPRKKRRGHRQAAKSLLRNGGLFNNYSSPGTTFWWVAQWHLKKARNG